MGRKPEPEHTSAGKKKKKKRPIDCLIDFLIPAVLLVGENRSGFPSKDSLYALAASNIAV